MMFRIAKGCTGVFDNARLGYSITRTSNGKITTIDVIDNVYESSPMLSHPVIEKKRE